MPADGYNPVGVPSIEIPPALANIVKAGVRAGREVPGSVALGGTVCALYAQHRLSIDIDFAVKDLAQRFDEVKDHLLELPGWREQRITPPVLILGSLDDVLIGFRQLRRRAPLDTIELKTPDGPLIVPTLEELLRIKAFLAYQRNYTRDYLDFAELSCLLPRNQVLDSLSVLDEKIAWEKQPAVALEIVKSLAACEPRDRDTHGFKTFKFLNPRLSSWEDVQKICRDIASGLAVRLVGQ